MSDISDLREGDEIEATIRMRLTSGYFTDSEGGIYPRYYLDEVAAITVVHPEIIPGKPYVDADGKLYVGKSGDRVVHVNAEGRGIYHGVGPEHRPLPAGLRPAKVVPE